MGVLGAGLVAVAFVPAARAGNYVPPPIQGYITDTAGVLSKEEVAALDEKLSAYRKCSTNHVVVFVPGTLGGHPVEDVAYGAFTTWKIGEAKEDNGVLLVLAPNDRKLKIETGKGVGGSLTDIESSRILREVATPRMKASQFFAAADEGTSAIGRALGGCAMAPARVVSSAPTVPAVAAPPPVPPPAAPAPPAPTPPEWTPWVHLAARAVFGASLFAVVLRQRLRRTMHEQGVRRGVAVVFHVVTSLGSAILMSVFAGIASLF